MSLFTNTTTNPYADLADVSTDDILAFAKKGDLRQIIPSGFKDDLEELFVRKSKAININSDASQRLEAQLNKSTVYGLPETVNVSWQQVEQNFGAPSKKEDYTSKPHLAKAVYGGAKVKTFAYNAWWARTNITEQLMHGATFLEWVVGRRSRWLEYHLSTLLLSILRSVGQIGALQINKNLAATTFPEAIRLLEKARGLRGLEGKPPLLYANVNTINWLLDNKETTKVHRYREGSEMKISDGTSGTIQSVTPNATTRVLYDGWLEIIANNGLLDNQVYSMTQGCVAYAERDVWGYNPATKAAYEPIVLDASDKYTGGGGNIKLGLHHEYAMQLNGTNFTGILGTDYATSEAVTPAEFVGGALYESTKKDAAYSDFHVVYVKV